MTRRGRIYVMNRVADGSLKRTAEGATIQPCAWCGVDLWLELRSEDLAQEEPPAVVVCLHCAAAGTP